MIGYIGVTLIAVCGMAASDTADKVNGPVELSNDNCRIRFDREHGGLQSITNALLGDECLKGSNPNDAPFRIYTDFTKEFEMADADYTKWFGYGPEVRGMCRTVLGPGNFRLKSVRQDDGLTFTYEGNGLELRLRVAFEKDERASVWSLRITNTDGSPRDILPSFPSFNEVALGPNPGRNSATLMNQAGLVTPAWSHPGGVVGAGVQMSMQWHAIWDPDSRSAFALIFMDPDTKPKQLRLENRGIELRYFPPVNLVPGASLDLPGDWRPAARVYRAWYDGAYTHAELPAWFKECDGWEGRHFKKAGSGVTDVGGAPFELNSFRELPGARLQIPVDNMEYAFFCRGAMLYNKHSDGDNIIREDLGGAEALRDGIAGSHRYGLHTTLYVEGYIVYKESELAKSGKAEQWSVMHKDRTITGIYTNQGFLHMCPGCVEWQDYLAAMSARLMRETGADGIRLDSLGTYFLPCYNPAHHHATPFGYNDWLKQLLSKVRDAVLAVKPDALLTTEIPVDWFGQWFHGALTQVYPRDLPEMRLAVGPYREFAWSPAGPVWGSLSGLMGGRLPASDLQPPEANWMCARTPVNTALTEGDIPDEDPRTSEPEVVTRAFHGDGYWAVVAARLASQESFEQRPYSELSGKRGEYTVTVQGVAPKIASGTLCDIETLTWKPLELNRAGADLQICLNTNWALMVLSEAGGPPIVSIDPLPELHPGESTTVHWSALQGEAKEALPLTVELVAAGLAVAPQSSSVPGAAVITAPGDALPGFYGVKVVGKRVLGTKRFLKVVETPK
ncbi:MAG: hypothetical protein HZB26_01545 [Candidatus Hydrogenedentes bacterium]|nr:hypothetical protein [Candidatus Hydrogenedentota bacterium]